jgi:hypothetical protein
MVQSSKQGLGNDAANGLNRARNRRIRAQRQVRASLIVISLVRFEQLAKMPLAQHNHGPGIPAGSSRSAVQRIHFAIRPVTKAHRPKTADENIAIDGITVTDDVCQTVQSRQIARDKAM